MPWPALTKRPFARPAQMTALCRTLSPIRGTS
jgi:hypothetical protein